MPESGWRRRRRATRQGGGALIDQARSLVEDWNAAPAPPPVSLPPWLAALGDKPGIGQTIDHTLLRPEAGRDAVLALCDEAVRFGLRAVCVNGCWVPDCVSRVEGLGPTIATVVGFPLGAAATKAKAAEARLAVGSGAGEIDMVLALGPAKSGEWRYVEDDIRRVVDATGGAPVRVIMETAALEPLEIATACLVARAAGAAFVTTSTGFHPAGGASRAAVALLRRAVGPDLGVKASGGIRSTDAALWMLLAGANRIGTSSAAAMASALGPSAPPLAQLLQPFLSGPPVEQAPPAASGY